METRRASGRPFADLTASNPTRSSLAYPPGLLEALADPSGMRYEPEPRGSESARTAVAARLREAVPDRPVHADDVLLSASTSEAYAFLLRLLCDPGDAVLVPQPSYPLFEYLAGLADVHLVPYALRWDGGWHTDLGSIHAADTSHVRALMVVHPNNPTGSYVKRSEAAALRTLCADRGWALVSDEVFADFPLRADDRREPTLHDPDAPCLTFTLGGLSKACALPQLKLAWTAVSGPLALRSEAWPRLDVVADTFLSVATPVQRALPALFAARPAIHRALQQRLEANLRALTDAAARAPHVTLLAPEGGWYAVLRVPAILDEDAWVERLLDRADVLVHPGWFFDFEGEAWLVASLLPPEDVFAPAARRALSVVEEAARDGVL